MSIIRFPFVVPRRRRSGLRSRYNTTVFVPRGRRPRSHSTRRHRAGRPALNHLRGAYALPRHVNDHSNTRGNAAAPTDYEPRVSHRTRDSSYTSGTRFRTGNDTARPRKYHRRYTRELRGEGGIFALFSSQFFPHRLRVSRKKFIDHCINAGVSIRLAEAE